MNRAITVALLTMCVSIFVSRGLAAEQGSKVHETVAGPPEPSTFALVGLGMTGLGLVRLRRHRR